MFKKIATLSVSSDTMNDALNQVGYHEKVHVNEKLNKKVVETLLNKKVIVTNPKNWYTDFSDGKKTYQVKFRKSAGFTLDKFLNNLKSDYIIYVQPDKDSYTFTTRTFKTKELQNLYTDCLKGNFPTDLKIETKVKNNLKYFKVEM